MQHMTDMYCKTRCRLHTHSSSSNGSADGHNSLLLSNDTSVKGFLHLDQLLALITGNLLNGDTCMSAASFTLCTAADRKCARDQHHLNTDLYKSDHAKIIYK